MTERKPRGAHRAPAVERRRHPRAATTFSADLVVDGRRYAARVINLSMGGALLDFHGAAARPRVAVGGRVSVEIRCRAIAVPELARFAGEGKAVLWNTTSAPEPMLAIQFDEVTGDAADTLEALLAEAVVDIGRLKAPADIP
jgi:hypothetical protein